MDVLKVKFNFPKLDIRLKKAHHRIEQFLAASMQTNRALLFDHEGAYSGHKKWAPLKLRSGKILSKRGNLRRSIGPPNDGVRPVQSDNGIIEYRNGIVKIGSNLAYASVQNDGAVIKAKSAKALKIPIEGSKDFLFRKKVTIPARNFDSITPEDKEEFTQSLKAILVEVLQDGED
jgi:phage gpG-like protein